MKRKKLLLATASAAVAITAVTFLTNYGVGTSRVFGSSEVIWYHYAQVEPTFESHGSRQFYTSSSDNCQTHTLGRPVGVDEFVEKDFSETDYFEELDENDDRYLAPNKELTVEEFLDKIDDEDLPHPEFTKVMYLHLGQGDSLEEMGEDTVENNWADVLAFNPNSIFTKSTFESYLTSAHEDSIEIVEKHETYFLTFIREEKVEKVMETYTYEIEVFKSLHAVSIKNINIEDTYIYSWYPMYHTVID